MDAGHSSARLARKTAIVTGGASGIGQATWTRFLAEGARVVVADRDTSIEKAITQQQPAAIFVEHDVRSRDSWTRLVETTKRRYGGLDILVNCAGILREGTIEDTQLSDWRAVLDVNLSGVFFGCQAVTPLLQLSGGAAIV